MYTIAIICNLSLARTVVNIIMIFIGVRLCRHEADFHDDVCLSSAYPTVLLYLSGNVWSIYISGQVGQRTPCYVRTHFTDVMLNND